MGLLSPVSSANSCTSRAENALVREARWPTWSGRRGGGERRSRGPVKMALRMKDIAKERRPSSSSFSPAAARGYFLSAIAGTETPELLNSLAVNTQKSSEGVFFVLQQVKVDFLRRQEVHEELGGFPGPLQHHRVTAVVQQCHLAVWQRRLQHRRARDVHHLRGRRNVYLVLGAPDHQHGGRDQVQVLLQRVTRLLADDLHEH
ncbi:hypothetical protein EYF80_051529 [Liparis tanakae]|uniref:Uncharacterized protein n=1 Tax=Liparis tanakae TaxID=230148 RepID=A0A4Z2FD61_9TELE|nr:hypothetical protein EYF80_051529 [Liparis tanakae]